MGLCLSWDLGRSMCAMNGNQQIMWWGQGVREGVAACGSMCQQPIASKVISYLPFPFLYILGMPSRDSPSLHFIDKNTKAQGRDVTCPI